MSGQMLDPSALDWVGWIGGLVVALLLLAWSLARPRPPHNRRDDES